MWSAIALPSARGAMPVAPLCLPRMPTRTRRRRRRAARRVRAQRPSSLCQHPVSSQVKLCCFPLRSLRWASGCRAQLATERTAAAAPRGPARRIRRCRPVSQVHDFSHFSHSFRLRPFPIKFCKLLLVKVGKILQFSGRAWHVLSGLTSSSLPLRRAHPTPSPNQGDRWGPGPVWA